MKKILSLLLAFTLLGLSTAARAETASDLSHLSNDELLTLLADVQQEVVSRRLGKTARLLAGTYVVGYDIPAGVYTLCADGQDDQSGSLYLRTTRDPDGNYTSKLYEYIDAADQYAAYVRLEEGDVLELPFPFTLTVFAGVMFN